jgi:hypothetical protein
MQHAGGLLSLAPPPSPLEFSASALLQATQLPCCALGTAPAARAYLHMPAQVGPAPQAQWRGAPGPQLITPTVLQQQQLLAKQLCRAPRLPAVHATVLALHYGAVVAQSAAKGCAAVPHLGQRAICHNQWYAAFQGSPPPAAERAGCPLGLSASVQGPCLWFVVVSCKRVRSRWAWCTRPGNMQTGCGTATAGSTSPC